MLFFSGWGVEQRQGYFIYSLGQLDREKKTVNTRLEHLKAVWVINPLADVLACMKLPEKAGEGHGDVHLRRVEIITWRVQVQKH